MSRDFSFGLENSNILALFGLKKSTALNKMSISVSLFEILNTLEGIKGSPIPFTLHSPFTDSIGKMSSANPPAPAWRLMYFFVASLLHRCLCGRIFLLYNH